VIVNRQPRFQTSARALSQSQMLSYKTFAGDQSREWVVFVHGAGGSSAVWFKQLRDFKERFNILLVDLRGHGRSSEYHGDGRKYTLSAISQDIVDVLEHEGIDSAHFVGVSLGTILIRMIVDIAPGKVQSVIYAGAVAGFTLSARSLISIGQALKFIVPFKTLYATFAWIIMPGKQAQESRKVFRQEARRVAPEEFRRWVNLIPEVRKHLKQWSTRISECPSLYLMGGKDYMFLPPARLAVSQAENSYLEVIEDVGHVCNIERPSDFNSVAIAFLNRH